MSINSIATIAPVVLDNVWKKDGTNVVRLRFTYQRDKKYLRTNIVVRKEHMSRSGQIKDLTLREKVEHLVNETQRILSEIDSRALPYMSLDDIIKYVEKRQEQQKVFQLDFFQFCDVILSEKTGQSQKTYGVAVNSFKKYVGKEEMDISEITSSLHLSMDRPVCVTMMRRPVLSISGIPSSFINHPSSGCPSTVRWTWT